MCASQRAVENRDCDCRGWSAELSDNAAADGGRWRSASSDDADKGEWWRRGSGQLQLLVRLLSAEKRRAQTTTLMSGGGG